MSVLNEHTKDVKDEVSSHVSIVNGIDRAQLTVFDKLLDCERIGVVAGNHSNSIAENERTEKGCCLNKDVIIETDSKGATDKSNSDLPCPVSCLASTNCFVHKGVV